MNHSEELKSLLKIKDEGNLLLSTREGSRIEYKESLNFSSLALYAKTMAGQANNTGGYLIFGIKDSPREIIGLTNNRFDEIDPVKITRFLNANFNPEIKWELDVVEIFSRKLGYIYTYEAEKKPIICTANNGNDLHEARIYYRYRGLTTDIRYPELRKLFDDVIENERNMWFRNLEKIAKVGPENVMVIDLINNELIGKNKSYIIDESLVEKIKFIKAGSFNENDGEPTLKLIGDVIKTSDINVTRNVPISIDFDSLIIAFLSQRSMLKDEALAYLKESFDQNSVYVPMFYFLKMSEIGLDEVSAVIGQMRHLSKYHIDDIEKKLHLKLCIPKIISDVELQFIELPKEMDKLLEYIERQPTYKARRKTLSDIILKYPGYIQDNTGNIDAGLLLQSISEFPKNTILSCKDEIFRILLELYMNEYKNFESGEKTNFRKAISRIDDTLFCVEN